MSKQDKEDSHKAKKRATQKRGNKDLQNRVDELTEQLLRERADSENLRRRHEVQVSELKKYVKAEVIRELLPVIDNIDRALKHIPKDLSDNDYVKGVQGVAKQFDATLQKLGVEKIKTVGEPFNPELHEAVSMDDSGKGTEEVVSDELQSGFILGDQVIRHAMVKVKLADKK